MKKLEKRTPLDILHEIWANTATVDGNENVQHFFTPRDERFIKLQQYIEPLSVVEICATFEIYFIAHGFKTMKQVIFKDGCIVIAWESGGYSNVLDYSCLMIEDNPRLLTHAGHFYEAQKNANV